MPKHGNAGYSRYTKLKQEHFAKFVAMHLQISGSVIRRRRYAFGKYVYIDMNAGPGEYPELGNLKGSPRIFVEEADAANVPFTCVAIDNDPKAIESLKSFSDTLRDDVYIVQEDYNTALPRLMRSLCKKCDCGKKAFGLLYSDETGKSPPFDLIGASLRSACCRCFDVLIHVSATTIKREVGALGRKNLIERFSVIGKAYWLIREPYWHFG